jgi:hypothetical protein
MMTLIMIMVMNIGVDIVTLYYGVGRHGAWAYDLFILTEGASILFLLFNYAASFIVIIRFFLVLFALQIRAMVRSPFCCSFLFVSCLLRCYSALAPFIIWMEEVSSKTDIVFTVTETRCRPVQIRLLVLKGFCYFCTYCAHTAPSDLYRIVNKLSAYLFKAGRF